MTKRIVDVLLSLLVLVLCCPIILLLIVTIRINLSSPVFFMQQRPGINGKAFYMIKFRTMLNSTGPSGELLPDEARMTRLGTFLRQSSLDELPEFWNVLKGEMSLVGPRPLLMQYLPLYNKRQNRRHKVAPGITGWAQVNGRNALSWEEKFNLDVWYVDNRNFLLDIKILCLTLYKVFIHDGVSKTGHATTDYFQGNL